MTESAKPHNDMLLEASTPAGAVPLESILCTEELQRRPSRPPEYEKENCALMKLVSALADSPSTIFQTLAETILDVTQCDSAPTFNGNWRAAGRRFRSSSSPPTGMRPSARA